MNGGPRKEFQQSGQPFANPNFRGKLEFEAFSPPLTKERL